MAVSHAIHIRIRELNDEEEDACKNKEKAASEKDDREESQEQHAQPEAI